MTMRTFKQIYYRWAPSLGALEDIPEKIWGVKKYDPEKHMHEPTVFCGLYGLPDFYALWRHKGKKYVWWTGTDITHFKKGYWLDDVGKIKMDYRALAEWINKNCECWVENEVESIALLSLGIYSQVCPSFMADLSKFNPSYKWSIRPKLYTSVSGDNFPLYGWHRIDALARDNPKVEFHLYGNRTPWKSRYKNVIVHGRVPKEQMNREIKKMQGGLRLTEFDGFSEIIAKSILWGQWPVSLISYPHTLDPQDIHHLTQMTEPNIDGRNYYKKILNKYPWNRKK